MDRARKVIVKHHLPESKKKGYGLCAEPPGARRETGQARRSSQFVAWEIKVFSPLNTVGAEASKGMMLLLIIWKS